jgi:tetratricopeptide (TPR) repeat protein
VKKLPVALTICCFVFFILISFTGFSLTVIDSLYAQLDTLKTDSIRIIYLNKTVYKYSRIKVSVAEQLSDTAILYSKNVGSDYLLALSYMNRGLNKREKGDFSSSILYYDSALVLAEKMNNGRALASIYNNIGNLYRQKGEFDKALENLTKSIEHTTDSVRRASRICNIALIYHSQKKYDQAIDIYKQSNAILEKVNNKRHLINNYSALAVIYLDIEEFEEAVNYAEKAMQMSNEAGDMLGQARALSVLGRIAVFQQDFDEGIAYLKKSMELTRETEADINLLMIHIYLAEAYYETGIYDSSIFYGKQAEVIANENKLLQFLKDSYSYISNSYMQKGQYKEAYEYLELRNNVYDTINQKETQERVDEFQSKFETKEKENEIIALKLEKEKKQALIRLYVALLFAIGVALTIIGYLYRKKQLALYKLVEKNQELAKKYESRPSKATKNGNNEKQRKLYKQCIEQLENDEIYTDNNLSLEKLSKILNTNRSEMSAVINNICDTNYASMINGYRIKHAIRMLSDPQVWEKYSVEGIAMESGFKSQSAFYKLFKEQTGLTPINFVKNKSKT